jgi:hypothetical protein
MDQSFDLTPARDAERKLRFLRWFGLAFAAVIFVEFFVGLHALSAIRLPLGSRGADAVGTVAGTSTLGAFFWFGFSPGASSIELGPRSLVLDYDGRRRKRIDLSRPGRRVKLYVYPKTWASGNPRSPPYQVLFTVFPFRNPLTPEAYEGLVDWSRRQGLRIDDKAWALDGPAPTHTVLIGVPRR